MMRKNVWFTLTSNNNGNNPGIRRTADKLTNFNYALPLFKNKKMFFPIDKKTSEPLQIGMDQLKLVMKTGFKGKDDFLDTISMLPHMDAVKPGAVIATSRDSTGIWSMPKDDEISTLSSYIV